MRTQGLAEGDEGVEGLLLGVLVGAGLEHAEQQGQRLARMLHDLRLAVLRQLAQSKGGLPPDLGVAVLHALRHDLHAQRDTPSAGLFFCTSFSRDALRVARIVLACSVRACMMNELCWKCCRMHGPTQPPCTAVKQHESHAAG